MTLHRTITLYRLITGDSSPPPDLVAESVALRISVLMTSGIGSLALSARGKQDPLPLDADDAMALRRLSRIAILLGGVGIVGSCAVAAYAYQLSRRSILDDISSMIQYNVQYLARYSNLHHDDSGFLRGLEELGSHANPALEGAYVCVADSDGTLLLHTAQFEKVGRNISNMALAVSDPNGPATFGDFLAARGDWAGEYAALDGQRQLISLAYADRADLLIAIHTPMDAIAGTIRTATAPWIVGVGLLTLVLIPLSLSMLHQSYVSARRTAGDRLGKLQVSERRVRKQLAELEHIYDTAPVGLCLMDVNLRYLRINHWLADINGISAEAHIGRTLREIVPEIAASMEEVYRRVVDTGESVIDVLATGATPSAPQEVRHFLASYHPLKDEAGIVWGLSSIVRDVTESKRAKDRLQKSEQQLRLITDNVHGLIAYIDCDQRLQYVNDRYTQAVGLRREEIIGRRCKEILTPSAYDAIRKHLKLALAGQPQRFETSLELKSGETVWRDATYVPDFDDGGQVRGLYTLVIDVTERKEAEEEQRRLGEQLRQSQKMEAVGTLAAGIAHDFNNLITAVLAGVGVARNVASSEDELQKALNTIEAAGEQAIEVTARLLAFSRTETKSRRPLDLCEAIEESVGLLEHLLPSAIEVKTKLRPRGTVWVLGDATQLQEMLMNLSINARDAMPNGGRLRIEVTAGEPDDARAVLTVEDTGTGMPEAVQARLFDPFFTTKPREQGTGLGMAVVQRIIQDHQGHIEVASVEGEGTRVTVALPCCDPPAANLALPGGGEAPDWAGQVVLLAQNDRQLRAIITATLASRGFKCCGVRRGRRPRRLCRPYARCATGDSRRRHAGAGRACLPGGASRDPSEPAGDPDHRSGRRGPE